MTTLANRLNELMAQKNKVVVDLQKALGVTYEMARRYTLGTAIPRDEKIERMAVYFGVTPAYLKYGATDNDNEVDIKPDVEIIDKQSVNNSYVEIDLYDVKLSAGTGEGCVVEWIPRKSDNPLLFPKTWFRQRNVTPNSCKAMYVRGNSMFPVLKNWDTVVVNIHDTEIIDGEIYALIYKNNFYIKQVVRNGDKITLISFNTEFDVIDINEDQLPDLKIVGHQIWRGG